ncbi:ParA family protein [Bradyrhizobium sp. 61]|uniref:ParA family protein n=1 Tax=Bradyrhizobium sp. 61 TaxID=2782679 RepID=UPI0023DFB7EB|nr:ParA family protein [Bradyrhizobium sp. 61]MCK1281803.1 ParA family protein [Bradyrhizobium sp. 61]
MILTFASSKGGVGKSTTCAAVAAALALEGARVLIIDLDQNRTLARWSRRGVIEGLTVAAVETQKFGGFFRDSEASGAYDHICIDLPGTREVTLFKALARSDLVIIPAQASEPDLREALVVVGDIRDVSDTTGRQIPYRLLLTKIFPLRSRVTDFAYAELARNGLPLFRTALVERSAYREMFLNGQPPTVTEPEKGAGAEITALIAEMRAIVNGPAELLKAG